MELTIYYDELELDVKFDYQPEEKAVMYYRDGSGYPGCAEEISVYEIMHDGYDVTEYFHDDMENIEELLHEEYGSDYYDYDGNY